MTLDDTPHRGLDLGAEVDLNSMPITTSCAFVNRANSQYSGCVLQSTCTVTSAAVAAKLMTGADSPRPLTTTPPSETFAMTLLLIRDAPGRNPVGA